MGLLYNRQKQKPRRQRLRNHATRAEIALWLNLKGKQLLGSKFRRQFGVGRYIIDFYCPTFRLAIELDGSSHEGEQAKAYDEQRQKEIEQYGIRFLRFSNEAVLENMEEVLRVIVSEIGKSSGCTATPVSPPRGGGDVVHDCASLR